MSQTSERNDEKTVKPLSYPKLENMLPEFTEEAVNPLQHTRVDIGLFSYT